MAHMLNSWLVRLRDVRLSCAVLIIMANVRHSRGGGGEGSVCSPLLFFFSFPLK